MKAPMLLVMLEAQAMTVRFSALAALFLAAFQRFCWVKHLKNMPPWGKNLPRAARVFISGRCHHSAKQWGLAARRVSDVKSTYRARRLAHESADAACDARSTGHDCAVQCISRFVPCGLPTILLGQTSEEYAAMGQKPATGCSCIHLWTVSPQREAMGIGCPTSF